MTVKRHYFCFVFIGLSSIAYTHSMDDIENFANLELELFEDDDSLAGDILTHKTPAPATAAEVVTLLITQANALTLLQESLFLSTAPLNTRNPLDYTFFLPRLDYAKRSNFQMQLFWNQTNAMALGQGCNGPNTGIASYLGIQNPAITAQLNMVNDAFGGDFDPIGTIGLFKNTKIQERKFGFMFTGEHHFHPFTFCVSAPFYYAERNFYLTPDEQTAIEDAFGKGSEDETWDFAQKHLISDKIGLGDTRASFVFDMFQRGELQSRVGVFTTLPTSFSFFNSVMGTHFEPTTQPPTLDLVKLLSYAQGSTQQDKDIAQAIGEEFFLGSIDHLAANILDVNLGYRKHVGLGAFLVSQTPLTVFIKRAWADDLYFKNKMSLQYLLPGDETRFFTELNDNAEYEALGLNRSADDILNQVDADPAYANQVLNFFQDQLTEMFYPFVRTTRVSPGFVFESTSRLIYEKKRWFAYLGMDTWVQGKEKLGAVTFEKSPILLIPDRQKAAMPVAYQGKVQTAIGYTVKRPERILLMMLHADYTITSSGIGQDFTISLMLETNF